MKTRVIMLAGGRGERMKSEKNKILLSVCGIPAIIRSISAFIPFSDEMIIVSRPEDQEEICEEIRKSGVRTHPPRPRPVIGLRRFYLGSDPE